jgi:cytidylate kinase
VTDEIRNSDVTRAVSVVASMPEVRRIMVERQRAIRDRHPRLVTEGRDQGSVVFPDAQVILYLDASPEERARRRTHQLRESGKVLPDEMSVEQVLRDLIRRDELDRSRSDGPLVTPSNALIVDTTHMDEAAVVDHLEALVRRVLSESAAESLDPDSRS